MKEHSLQLGQVFASPTFLGSPMLMVLDEIQVASNASRLDALIEGPEQSYLISSALVREREDDGNPQRKWQPPQKKDSIQWAVAQLVEQSPSRTNVRKALSTSDRLLKLDFGENGRIFKGYPDKLKEITLWFGPTSETHEPFLPADCENEPAFQQIQEKLVFIEAALKQAERVDPRDNPFKEIANPFGGLKDQVSLNFLQEALEPFDKWLRGLLKSHWPEQIKEYDFLNQFFWVTRPPNSGGKGNSQLALVKPVFLEEQRKRLLAEIEKQGSNRGKTPAEDLKWISDEYELDSRSLFSAFPADTKLSLYVEDWVHEPLPIELDEQRKFFGEVTQRAQRAAIDTRLGQPSKMTLFSVPVLVERQPLFITTMFLPTPLTTDERIELAGHIQALGGVMHLEAKRYDSHRQTQLQHVLDERRIAMSLRAKMVEVSDSIVASIPAEVIHPLRSSYQLASRLGKTELTLKIGDAARFIEEIDGIACRAASLAKPLKSESTDTERINLGELIQKAINEVPLPRACQVVVSSEHDVCWWVEGSRELLRDALSEMIFAAGPCVHECGLTIRLRNHYEQSSVTVEFIVGQTEAKELSKEFMSRTKLLRAAETLLLSMNIPVEVYEKSVKTEQSQRILCAITLPLARRGTESHVEVRA